MNFLGIQQLKQHIKLHLLHCSLATEEGACLGRSRPKFVVLHIQQILDIPNFQVSSDYMVWNMSLPQQDAYSKHPQVAGARNPGCAERAVWALRPGCTEHAGAQTCSINSSIRGLLLEYPNALDIAITLSWVSARMKFKCLSGTVLNFLPVSA